MFWPPAAARTNRLGPDPAPARPQPPPRKTRGRLPARPSPAGDQAGCPASRGHLPAQRGAGQWRGGSRSPLSLVAPLCQRPELLGRHRDPPSRPFPGHSDPRGAPGGIQDGGWALALTGLRSGWESCYPEQDPQSTEVPALPGPPLHGVTLAPKSSIPQIQTLCVMSQFPHLPFQAVAPSWSWPHTGQPCPPGTVTQEFPGPLLPLPGVGWVPMDTTFRARHWRGPPRWGGHSLATVARFPQCRHLEGWGGAGWQVLVHCGTLSNPKHLEMAARERLDTRTDTCPS